METNLLYTLAQKAVSHPFLSISRQSQINPSTVVFHTNPFTVVPMFYNLIFSQGVSCLWKGFYSNVLTEGLRYFVEIAFQEYNSEQVLITKKLDSLLWKIVSLSLVIPFQITSIVTSVRSSIATIAPGVWDVLISSMNKVFGVSQSSSSVPFYVIAPLCLVDNFISCGVYYLIENRQISVKESDRCGDDFMGTVDNGITAYSLAASTSCLSTLVLYPLRTLLARLIVQGTRSIIDDSTGLGVMPVSSKYEGVRDCCLSILALEGFSGFYKGFGAFFLECCLHLAIVWGLQKGRRYISDLNLNI